MKSIGLALLALLLGITLVHSGRTDSNGGHWDYSTGEYHYHHGYPAHQHPNGVCPYNYDDATNHSSTSSQDRSITTSRKESSVVADIFSRVLQVIAEIFSRVLLVIIVALFFPKGREFLFALVYLLWLKIRDFFVFVITKLKHK